MCEGRWTNTFGNVVYMTTSVPYLCLHRICHSQPHQMCKINFMFYETSCFTSFLTPVKPTLFWLAAAGKQKAWAAGQWEVNRSTQPELCNWDNLIKKLFSFWHRTEARVESHWGDPSGTVIWKKHKNKWLANQHHRVPLSSCALGLSNKRNKNSERMHNNTNNCLTYWHIVICQYVI